MEAANITGSDGTLNGQAKSAARPASDSTKRRIVDIPRNREDLYDCRIQPISVYAMSIAPPISRP